MMNRKEIPVVPARGGAEVALDLMIRPFSSIELACAVRRAPCAVRACFVRTCCAVASREGDRPATTLARNIKRTDLHTSHCTLQTMRFTLHTCTSHSTVHLISNHLIPSHLMSPHLTSSHLIPSLLTRHLSKFFSTVFILSEH